MLTTADRLTLVVSFSLSLALLSSGCGPATTAGGCKDAGDCPEEGQTCAPDGLCRTVCGSLCDCPTPAEVCIDRLCYNCDPGLLCFAGSCVAPPGPGDDCSTLPCAFGYHCGDT